MAEELLTKRESDWLSELESTIARGMRTFTEVGNALLEIRDNRLYRESHKTFEDYCRDKWGMSRIHAHRMIEAASVTDNLLPTGNILPESERQARPLTSLPTPEAQREVWQRAVETAPGGKVTAAHVQAVVEEYKRPAPVAPPPATFLPQRTIAQEEENPRVEAGNMPERPHVANNSGNNEWYTPPEFIAAAVEVMGAIDCDPASSDIANRLVGAAQHWTAEDDGLSKDWFGRVWLNPPYSQPLIARFCDKLAEELRRGVTEACVLVNNATETAWFNTLLEDAAAVCFIRSRVKFLDPSGNPGAPLQGQVVLYFGGNVAGFSRAFSKFGKVLYARRD